MAEAFHHTLMGRSAPPCGIHRRAAVARWPCHKLVKSDGEARGSGLDSNATTGRRPHTRSFTDCTRPSRVASKPRTFTDRPSVGDKGNDRLFAYIRSLTGRQYRPSGRGTAKTVLDKMGRLQPLRVHRHAADRLASSYTGHNTYADMAAVSCSGQRHRHHQDGRCSTGTRSIQRPDRQPDAHRRYRADAAGVERGRPCRPAGPVTGSGSVHPPHDRAPSGFDSQAPKVTACWGILPGNDRHDREQKSVQGRLRGCGEERK